MPTLNSGTECQASPANATTQAWQRLCPSQRRNKRPDKQTDEREHRSHKITNTQSGVSCFVGQESSKFKVRYPPQAASGIKIPASVWLRTVEAHAKRQ